MRTRSRPSDLLPAALAVECITLTGEKICVQLSQASPTPGAPYTHVTTEHVLSAFDMRSLRDLPDIEALEDAGLFGRRIAQADAKVIGAESDGDEGDLCLAEDGQNTLSHPVHIVNRQSVCAYVCNSAKQRAANLPGWIEGVEGPSCDA